MFTNTAEGNQSYSHDRVEQLVDRVAELEATVEEQQATINDQSERIDEMEATVEEQADEIEELQDELRETKTHSGRERAELSGRIATVEDEIDDMVPQEARAADSSEDEPQGVDDTTTALEQVCALPEETAEKNLTANQQRARFVAKDISDYGRKVPAGIAIKSSEIRRVLCAAEEGKTHTQTVSRVIGFLDRFGDSEVNEKKTRSGETTVVFTEEIVDRITEVVIEERQPAVIETAI